AASTTDSVQASQILYNDPLAQAGAERTTWPYNWFNHASYAPASGRGTATRSSSFTVANGATLYLAGGALSVSGSIINNGTVKLSGTPTLISSGSFINNG